MQNTTIQVQAVRNLKRDLELPQRYVCACTFSFPCVCSSLSSLLPFLCLILLIFTLGLVLSSQYLSLVPSPRHRWPTNGSCRGTGLCDRDSDASRARAGRAEGRLLHRDQRHLGCLCAEELGGHILTATKNTCHIRCPKTSKTSLQDVCRKEGQIPQARNIIE